MDSNKSLINQLGDVGNKFSQVTRQEEMAFKIGF